MEHSQSEIFVLNLAAFESAKSFQKLLILVVEDCDVIQKTVCSILKRLKHECIIAKNGAEGLEMFKQSMYQNRRIDLIFMDIEMPVMNGIVATEQIRLLEKQQLNDSPVPIICGSAIGDEASPEKAIKAGVSEFICKPYTFQKIISMIAKYCESRLDNNIELIADNVSTEELDKSEELLLSRQALDLNRAHVPLEQEQTVFESNTEELTYVNVNGHKTV